jgi:uncharacterized membrane protein
MQGACGTLIPMKTHALLIVILSIVLAPLWTTAQSVQEEVSEVVGARVLRVISTETREIPGTDTPHLYQTIEAEISEGSTQGMVVTVQNDFLALEADDHFFLIRHIEVGGDETYYVQDVDRRKALLWLIGGFVGLIILFGGWYGFRSILALSVSLLVLGYVLVPGLLGGWNPLLACFGVAGLILAGALFITHGINRESCIAFIGTLLAVLGTLLLAQWSVSWTALSGFGMDESVYLNFNSRGSLDIIGLLIGSIVIGALGVLDDIAITQVAVVRELLGSTPNATRRSVFIRAMRVGREHVGAVVNTLALAYVGASLPLVLLIHTSPMSGRAVFNMEIFATELVRTIVGSFGIVLTVPLVTFLAVRYLRPVQSGVQEDARVHVHHH